MVSGALIQQPRGGPRPWSTRFGVRRDSQYGALTPAENILNALLFMSFSPSLLQRIGHSKQMRTMLVGRKKYWATLGLLPPPSLCTCCLWGCGQGGKCTVRVSETRFRGGNSSLLLRKTSPWKSYSEIGGQRMDRWSPEPKSCGKSRARASPSLARGRAAGPANPVQPLVSLEWCNLDVQMPPHISATTPQSEDRVTGRAPRKTRSSSDPQDLGVAARLWRWGPSGDD